MHERRDEIFSLTKDAGGLGYILLIWGRRKLWQKGERERQGVRLREGSGWEREEEVKGGDDDGWECRFWVERQADQPDSESLTSKDTSQSAPGVAVGTSEEWS
jgi:hypothetical protein